MKISYYPLGKIMANSLSIKGLFYSTLVRGVALALLLKASSENFPAEFTPMPSKITYFSVLFFFFIFFSFF